MLVARPPYKPSPIEVAGAAMVKSFATGRPANPSDEVAKAIVTKADQTLNTTSSLAAIAPSLVGDFLAGLAPISAAARLIAMGMRARVPAQSIQSNNDGSEFPTVSLTIPTRSSQPPTTTPWVAEGSPIPVKRFTLDGSVTLVPKKFAFIVAFSRELAKRADGENVIRTMMREDAAAALDAAYFSTTALSSAAHPGLLNGLTAGTGYGGGDRTAMQADFGALATAVAPGGSGQMVFIVSPTRAAKLPILWPEFDAANVLPSLVVADDTMIAIDPMSLVHGFGDDVDMDVSEEAVLHFEDTTPLEIVSAAGTVADPTRSLYQTAVLALRLMADVAFAKRRSGAVAYLTALTW